MIELLILFLVSLPPPDDCNDKICIADSMKSADCWSIECTKQKLIELCESDEPPEYLDCTTILECIDLHKQQTDYCAGNGYPANSISSMKI